MKYILTGLFLALSTLTFAQSNFVPGYVITNTKDSLSGYIDRKDWSLNPSTVNFKPTLAGNVRIFSKTDCIAFGAADQESYQLFVVDISQSSVDVNTLSVGPDNSSKKDTVFLNVLQAGKNVILYGYRDALKMRFYIKESNSLQPVELIQQQYLQDSKSVVNDNRYVGQLLVLMTKYRTALLAGKSNIKYSRYYKNDMVKIAALINDQQPKKIKSSVRFYAGAGLNINKVNYLSRDLTGASSEPSFLPMLSVGVDMLPDPGSERSAFFRLDMSFLFNKTAVTANTTDPARSQISHAYNESTLAITPQFIYNIYNTNKVKAYAGAGIGVNLSIYDITSTDLNSVRNEYSVVKINQSHYSVLYTLKAGVVLNKNIELAAGYALSYVDRVYGQSQYDPYKIRVQRYSIGVSYLFGRN